MKRFFNWFSKKENSIYETWSKTRQQKELENAVDFAISINVLDYCYNFEKIIRNVYSYMKGGTTAFFSFDSHEITDACLPLTLQLDNCLDMFRQTRFHLEKHTKGMPETFYERYHTHTYGHGEYCLNFWLSKLLA